MIVFHKYLYEDNNNCLLRMTNVQWIVIWLRRVKIITQIVQHLQGPLDKYQSLPFDDICGPEAGDEVTGQPRLAMASTDRTSQHPRLEPLLPQLQRPQQAHEADAQRCP